MTKTVLLLFFIMNFTFLFAKDNPGLILHKAVLTGDPAIESGDLYLYGNEELKIPDVFSYITDHKTAYQFVQRNTSSGKEGFFPVEQVTIQNSKVTINEDQLRDEFYLSRVRLEQTPDNWMYGVCSEGTFFSLRGVYSD